MCYSHNAFVFNLKQQKKNLVNLSMQEVKIPLDLPVKAMKQCLV